MIRGGKSGSGEGGPRLEKDPVVVGSLRLTKEPIATSPAATQAHGEGALRLGADAGIGTRGDEAASGAGGLRLVVDSPAAGGLRLEVADRGGATPQLFAPVSVEAAGARSGFVAPPPPPTFFSFTDHDIRKVDTELGKGDAVTLQLLGLLDERAALFAGEVPPRLLCEKVSAFVRKKQELESKGTNFQHLKRMPAHFKRWCASIEDLANKDAEACAAELLRLAREEVRAALAAEARKAYETNDTLEKVIDYNEWVVLQRTAIQGLGLPQREALAMCLDVCRQVSGDPGWSPPPEPAEALRLLAEKRKGDEAARKRDEAALKRAQAREKQLAEARLKAEAEADAARAREAEAKALHEREQIARQRDEEERKRAEEERKRAEIEAAAERARLEERRAQHAREHAVVRLSVRGVLAGGLVGLVLAAAMALVGTPTIALVQARKDMVAAMPESRIREVCGLGRELSGMRTGLKVELGDRLAEVALSAARERAATKGLPVCNGSQGTSGDGDTPPPQPAPTPEAR